MTHFPPIWRYRVLAAIKGKGSDTNRELLAAWAKAEGGRARWNPLNTTQWMPGATDYNSAHVRNYRTPADGIKATAITLTNGYYPGIVSDLRDGTIPAAKIVQRHRAEFDKWGTGADHILRLLT